MSKIVVIGDIHGCNKWKQVMQAHGDATEFVFIGDYFDSFTRNHAECISNFKEIIKWKEGSKIKVTMLIGNHDFHYMSDCGGRYGGWSAWHAAEIGELLRENKHHLQVAYSSGRYLFSHAGISKEWYESVFPDNSRSGDIADQVNELWSYDKRSFNHTGMDVYGDDSGEGPMWIRPKSLISSPLHDSWIQIVGHTHMHQIKHDDNHYFIDTLPYEYLCIENGVPVIYKL
jgi:predicted phosphodiesterase